MATYLEQLETPVPVVDLDRLALNLDRMAAYVTLHGLRLRPHVKTHKSVAIARRQLAAGARGLTAAKPSEAAVFAAASQPSTSCDGSASAIPRDCISAIASSSDTPRSISDSA